MGLSQRKKTNRKFNGTKMVIGNTGTPSTLVPKNQFSETNQYPAIEPGTNNFVPCTFEQGLYDPDFVHSLGGIVIICLDQNPFYGENKLILGRINGTSVVDSKSGEVLINNTSLTNPLSIAQLPLNQYLWSGNSNRFLRKLNADLSFDNSFILGFRTSNPVARSLVKITPDNKILTYMRAGQSPFKINYTANTPSYSQQIYKLNMDGSVDTSFFNQSNTAIDYNTQFSPANISSVFSIEIIPTNNPNYYKIAIGGKFDIYQDFENINITFLDENGLIDDEWFSPFTEIDDYITSIKYVGNSKILVGGFFKNVGGYSYILRMEQLNLGVGIDNTFIDPNLPGPVRSIDLDVDGKILVSYGVEQGNIVTTVYARLNPDGSIDDSFNTTNFISTGRASGEFIYKSSNGGYFLRGAGITKLESGESIPSFIKLKGC